MGARKSHIHLYMGVKTTQRRFNGVGGPLSAAVVAPTMAVFTPLRTPYRDPPTMIPTIVAVTSLTFPFNPSAR